MLPQVPVELLQTEVAHILHIMEESLFQNAYRIFYGTFIPGLFDFGRKDRRAVMFSPLSIIPVQLRIDPVTVGNNGLLAVVADNQCRYPAKIRQGIVVDSDPLRFFGGEHPFCIDVLRVRKDRHKDNDLLHLTGERIHHVKGLSGEVHLHLLSDDGIEMQRFLIFLAPLGIVFTVLPVRIELQLPVPAELGIPVPEHHQGHILLGGHLLVYSFIVGHLIAEVPATGGRILSVDSCSNAIIGDSLRKRIA